MTRFDSVKQLVNAISDDKQFNKDLSKMIDRKNDMKELRKRIEKSGFSRKKLAEKIGVRYMTLSGYLNEFVPFPDSVRKAVEDILMEVE